MSENKHTISSTMCFEDALEELEDLVVTLEAGEQTLARSLENFERGIALARFCQKSLGDANQKVQILLQESGEDNLYEFEKTDS